MTDPNQRGVVPHHGQPPHPSTPGSGYPQQIDPPPQGYPPQVQPPQGYPPQGDPPQGYPPQVQSPQGYPPQGYPPQGYPPQGYPPQGYPPQGYPPQGYPPQGYPPQGYPPQGYPPQGYPPQGVNVVVQNNIGTQGSALVRVADRNKFVAAVLAFFLGGFGVHKFYLGQTGMGVVYLIFCWTFIPGFIAFIESLLLLIKPEREFDLQFNVRRSW